MSQQKNERDFFLLKESCINCEVSLDMAQDFVASSIKKSLYELQYYENLRADVRRVTGLGSCENNEKKILSIYSMLSKLNEAYPRAKANPILYISQDRKIDPSKPFIL